MINSSYSSFAAWGLLLKVTNSSVQQPAA